MQSFIDLARDISLLNALYGALIGLAMWISKEALKIMLKLKK